MKLKPAPISMSTCVLIGKAYRGVYRRARASLIQHELTPTQFILLAALWELDGQSGAELGTTLGLDSASMTGLIDRSEANGLIQRRSDPQDRRINRVWLTSAGRAMKDPVAATMTAFDAEIANAVGGNIQALHRSLLKLADLR